PGSPRARRRRRAAAGRPPAALRRRPCFPADRRDVALYTVRPMSTETQTARDGQRPAGHADVAIVGAGYVGVPLAQVFTDAGRSVLLVDVSPERVAQLNRGESYIEDVPSEQLKQLVDERGLHATTDYDEL